MKYVVILGGGESGVGAALLAKNKDFKVFVSDFGEISPKYKQELLDNTIDFEESNHDFDRMASADLVVKSPGIPESAAVIRFLRGRDVPIISEIDFASRFFAGKIIAITGSNGKTTTTNLIFHMLNNNNMNVGVGGNIGASFARQIIQKNFEWMVLEVSSFQLDDIQDFRPEIAILLNITADHLDRYDYDIDKYAAAKCNIYRKQVADDYLIYNADDAMIIKHLEASKPFLAHRIAKSSKEDVRILKSNLRGRHNAFNISCAVEAAEICKVPMSVIEKTLETFAPIAHRLETVAHINGALYVNDSKATNVDAVQYAIDGVKGPIVWIAGGVDKGNDYTPILEMARGKIKALICLGKNNEKLKHTFNKIVPCVKETQSVKEAVQWSAEIASRDETVLLSPACASFDLFQNYEDRGQQFKEAVWTLIK